MGDPWWLHFSCRETETQRRGARPRSHRKWVRELGAQMHPSLPFIAISKVTCSVKPSVQPRPYPRLDQVSSGPHSPPGACLQSPELAALQSCGCSSLPGQVGRSRAEAATMSLREWTRAAPSLPCRQPDPTMRLFYFRRRPAQTWQLITKTLLITTTIKMTSAPLPPPITEPYYKPGAVPAVLCGRLLTASRGRWVLLS